MCYKQSAASARSGGRAMLTKTSCNRRLWRICRVHIYRHLRAELLQLARVVTRYVAVRAEVLGRVSPGRVGWISLAAVALGREMVTRLPFQRFLFAKLVVDTKLVRIRVL